MSYSRSAKGARRARRGISLPGATFVVLLASTAMSLAIEDRARDRIALNELMAARMIADWARALDGHILLNRAAITATLAVEFDVAIPIATLRANPNLSKSLVDPTGAAQPLAGWTLTFAAINTAGLPTGLIILTPPAADAGIAANAFTASLARVTGGASANASLDVSDARSTATRAGIVLNAEDIVLFAHEYAGLRTERITRLPRPGMVAATSVDIAFLNTDLTGATDINGASIATLNTSATTLNTASGVITTALTADRVQFADLEAAGATFTSAETAFSIFGSVSSNTVTATSTRGRVGEITSATSPLTDIIAEMTTDTVEITDTAILPSVPADAAVTSLSALRIFAPSVTLQSLQTNGCDEC